MEGLTTEGLVAALDEGLRAFSFLRIDRVPSLDEARVVALWKRKTWNTNRAVAVLDVAETVPAPGEVARRARSPLGRAVGYVPFLHVLGLQVVLVGKGLAGLAEGLDVFLDRIDNQRVLLQSLHAVDLAAGRSVSVRTWGQLFTGRFQDAIEATIEEYLAAGRGA